MDERASTCSGGKKMTCSMVKLMLSVFLVFGVDDLMMIFGIVVSGSYCQNREGAQTADEADGCCHRSEGC